MANDINSALVALGDGRLSAAKKICAKLLERNRKDFDAQHLMGLIELRGNRHRSALLELHKALAIRNDVASLHNNLGAAYQSLDDHRKALRCFERAVAIDPENPDYRNNLAKALERAGFWRDAYENYVKLLGRLQGAELGAARMARVMGDFAGARSQLARLSDSVPEVAQEMSLVIELEIDAVASVEYLRVVAGENPQNLKIKTMLASVLQYIGDGAEAIAQYESILALESEDKNALWELSGYSYFSEDAVTQISKQIVPRGLSDGELADWFHFRFRLCDSIGRYEDAGKNLVLANRHRSNSAEPNMKREADRIQQIKETAIQTVSPLSSSSLIPIFVVGMLRSGTSLIEQVLTSHSNIAGAGELTVLPTILNHFGFGERLFQLTDEEAAHIRQSYLAAITPYAGDCAYVVDKYPHNFENLAVISGLFPEAVIVHCQRNAMDTCFSCYKQFFAGQLPYVYDQKNLADYYKMYAGLMAFYKAQIEFPTVQYEKFINDLESEARLLLKHVGVDWEEQVLNFNESVRFVKTSSANQVRKPIYTTSIDSWFPYRQHLGVLTRELEVDQ